MSLQSSIINSIYLLTKVCRNSQKCAEDFKQLLELTGWSENMLYAVIFSAIFLVLMLIVFVLYKLQKRKVRPYRYKTRKRAFKKYRG